MQKMLPHEIETESFAIITRELGARALDEALAPIIKRVIHTTADFDYADNLWFSLGVLETALAALKDGAWVITDTNMAKAGVNKAALGYLGGEARCFIADEDVAAAAKQAGSTRAVAAVEKAAALERGKPLIFAVGNAPTALMHIVELAQAGRLNPALVIGAPVGFVNVVESKQLLEDAGIPCIVARGRKGGSNVAAAICNALLYLATDNATR